MPAKSKPNEIYISRVYAAPVAALWDAWTDPNQVAKWWGPRGFTITTHSKDLRPGGHWSYTMHGPDGVDYENRTIYYEVEERARLVYDHGGGEDRPPLFRVTVTFAEIDGKTHMDMTMALATPEAAQETKKFIKKAGGDSTWDRLAEYLEKETSGNEQFVINRTFAAPQKLLFDMWTKPEHLSQWLAPTGFTMEFHRVDIKSGGSGFYSMSGGDMKFYGRVNYIEIRPHDLLVYTQQFCDEQENMSRHPMAPTWPETMLTTVCFSPEDEDHTRVTVTWRPHGAVTPAELAAFVQARAGMTVGWTGSFDKLDELLAKR